MTNSRSAVGSGAAANGSGQTSSARSQFSLPFDFSYQADIWGGIRRSVRASAETAQATAAQLENARLTYQAELAQDYFQLRSIRSTEELLQKTVKSYEEFLDLTRKRFNNGVASGGDVEQAETHLYAAQTQLVDLEIARTQFEHAIALLIGQAPFSISNSTLPAREPPAIPVGGPPRSWHDARTSPRRSVRRRRRTS